MFDNNFREEIPQLPEHSVKNDEGKTPYPVLKFDPSPYLRYLDDSSYTEVQKQELLQAIWAVMVSFIDMGFEISPIQQAMDKSTKAETTLASGFDDVVKSKSNKKINQKKKLRAAQSLNVER